MGTTTLKNSTIDLEVESDVPIPADAADFNGLVKALFALRVAIPTTDKMDLQREAGDPTHFTYSYSSSDGRKFEQNFWFEDGKFWEDFKTTGFGTRAKAWRADEYPIHRPLRAACQTLIVAYGLAKVKCRW